MSKSKKAIRREAAAKERTRRRGSERDYDTLYQKAKALEKAVKEGDLSAEEKANLLFEAGEARSEHYTSDKAIEDFRMAGDFYSEAASEYSGLKAGRLHRKAQQAYAAARKEVNWEREEGWRGSRNKYSFLILIGSFLFFILGFSFIDLPITGNSIANNFFNSSSILGVAFLLVAMALAIFYMKKR